LARLLETGIARAKLRVNQPDDGYEREADRIADRALRLPDPAVQRRCTGCASGAPCAECAEEEERPPIQRQAATAGAPRDAAEADVLDGIGSGQPLEPGARAYFEPRFGADFSGVRVHAGAGASRAAHSVNAMAYTIGRDIVFAGQQYAPGTAVGRRLLAHELTHVLQQAGTRPGAGIGGAATPAIQRRAAPYIKKVTVHLKPPQKADLEWEGTPPPTAAGSDHFTVSTGKGYGDPGDPPGTCIRQCCSDPDTQCAPPWNRPDKVGACCTYYGDSYWTGTPQVEHNGWKWWTPIQPYYSTRGIALHQHDEVTGQPIGHGCVRMEEPNAKRIYDFSNGRRTNVTMDGRAAPVACGASRRCGATGAALGGDQADRLATAEPVPGLEGVLT
jgi:hypothetical protein